MKTTRHDIFIAALLIVCILLAVFSSVCMAETGSPITGLESVGDREEIDWTPLWAWLVSGVSFLLGIWGLDSVAQNGRNRAIGHWLQVLLKIRREIVHYRMKGIN